MGRVKTDAPVATTVGDLVSEALGELTALGEEFREICDNTPDSLQSTGVYEARDGTASTLEGLSEPDVEERLGGVPCSFAPWRPARRGRGLSRADRCAEACARLEAAVEALEAWSAEEGRSEDDSSAADDLITELDSVKSEAEGCEFPGMFG